MDANGASVLLRGVSLPVFDGPAPPVLSFRVIQQRWNMNAVRLPLSVASWQAGGQAYLDRAASLVSAANAEGLIVILGAHEN
ncbi:MAG TPA: cellulase family glycosylhydrolase, partial [Bryobacteraceae bacterium]